MHLQTVFHLQGVKVPNDDISLKALVGSLATSNVFTRVGDDNDGDLVVVTSEELLCSANNVSHNDRGSQREDDVLVVWMQKQSLIDLALETDNCR